MKLKMIYLCHAFEFSFSSPAQGREGRRVVPLLLLHNRPPKACGVPLKKGDVGVLTPRTSKWSPMTFFGEKVFIAVIEVRSLGWALIHCD